MDGDKDGETKADKSRAILAAAARRRDAGHNEKYYEEVGNADYIVNNRVMWL